MPLDLYTCYLTFYLCYDNLIRNSYFKMILSQKPRTISQLAKFIYKVQEHIRSIERMENKTYARKLEMS